MDQQQAAQDLQAIRTLMERSALYRRALAPILLFLGVWGTAGAVGGMALRIESPRAFGLYWYGLALAGLAGALLLARRQAFRAHEPFWSPPTRRLTRAILPGFASGFVLGLFLILAAPPGSLPLFVLVCGFFYATAVHAAGFFVPKALQGFAWLLIGLQGLLLLLGLALRLAPSPAHYHAAMGCFFGVLQLAYGLYLRATEPREPQA
jgi:hypothetical protein